MNNPQDCEHAALLVVRAKEQEFERIAASDGDLRSRRIFRAAMHALGRVRRAKEKAMGITTGGAQ